MRRNVPGAVLATLALVGVGLVTATPPAAAATITVTTTADVVDATDGLTSLREAFTAASTSAAADTIVLAATTYDLTDCGAGELVDGGTGDLTVEGNGATIHQTCDETRVVEKTQATGTLTLQQMTLTAVGSAAGLNGAGVLTAGPLVLDHAAITGIPNTAFGTVVEIADTPAVYDLEVLDSTIDANGGRAVKNSAIGGGVHVAGSVITTNTGGGVDLTDGSPLVVETSNVSGNGGFGLKTTGQGTTSLTVTDTTVNDNATTGISCGACGTVAISGTTVHGNGIGAGPGGGGGIAVTTDQDDPTDAPTVAVTGATVTGNVAQHDGGGLSVGWTEAHTATTAAATTVSDSTFDGNHADCTACDGGGIAVDVGSLTVTSTHVTANSAGRDGGGIAQNRRDDDTVAAPTTFALIDSEVGGNTAGADGGGVSTHGDTQTVERSLVADNDSAVGGGLALGGVFTADVVTSGSATIDASTITGNTATTHGGGIALRYPDGSTATVTSSTVHANSAPLGGGVAAGPTEPLALRYVTLTANTAGTGANLASSSPTTIEASVLAAPSGGGSSCAGFPMFGTAITSVGWSWSDDPSCSPGPTDVVAPGGDPLLGPLGPNGGPTPTRLPATGSPLGGLVPAASCSVPTDQRGEVRPAGVGCEPGAVEIVETSGIVGGPGGDLLFGTAAGDAMHGLGGDDLLLGLRGDDTLDGGPGNDVLIGGPGDDELHGGPGNDVLIGAPGHDVLDGGPGLDLCFRPGRILPTVC